MIKTKLLKNAEENYYKELENIETAYGIFKKVESHLPTGWKADYYAECLYLESIEGTPVEFRVVCSLIEKVIGRTLRRSASGNKRESLTLTAHSYDDFGLNEKYFSIHITSGGDDTCKVTFKEKMTTEAIVDPRCLGIKN